MTGQNRVVTVFLRGWMGQGDRNIDRDSRVAGRDPPFPHLLVYRHRLVSFPLLRQGKRLGRKSNQKRGRRSRRRLSRLAGDAVSSTPARLRSTREVTGRTIGRPRRLRPVARWSEVMVVVVELQRTSRGVRPAGRALEVAGVTKAWNRTWIAEGSDTGNLSSEGRDTAPDTVPQDPETLAPGVDGKIQMFQLMAMEVIEKALQQELQLSAQVPEERIPKSDKVTCSRNDRASVVV